jgi:hypothetical protein
MICNDLWGFFIEPLILVITLQNRKTLFCVFLRFRNLPKLKLMSVNSANVLDEGLRIGGRGRRMNSKVKVQTNKAKLGAC